MMRASEEETPIWEMLENNLREVWWTVGVYGITGNLKSLEALGSWKV